MNKTRKKLKIGITIGDIAGIGPELIIRSLQDHRFRDLFIPVIYGSSAALNIYRKILHADKFSYQVIQSPEEAQAKKVSLIDCYKDIERIEIGRASELGGKVAFAALQRAVADLKNNQLDSIVTLPIDKKSIQRDDFDFPGHTEYLTSAFNAPDSILLMTSPTLRVGLVTGHIPLKKVSESLSFSKIHYKIKLLRHTLQRDFGLEQPKIAVLGLNPHAGDRGLLGKEEREKIQKAVQQAVEEGMLVMGPYSSDGFFATGLYHQFDGILAMYHDQGLIPFKMLAGFEGVNYTAGLPIIRTSPDHGVAYDLAGKGKANTESFMHAVYTCIDVYRQRQAYDSLDQGAMKKEKAKANS